MSDFPSALRLRLNSHHSEVDRLRERKILLTEQLDDLNHELVSLSELVDTYEEAVGILNTIAQDRQSKALSTIESLVTMALTQVFDEPLSFHATSTTKGKSVTIDFTVKTTLEDGTQVETPLMSARGGGLVCVVGFILRLTVMILRGDKNPVLVLDETFGMLSDEYLDNMARFIKQASDSTGAQVIMVTHQPTFADHADTCYRLSQVNGRTKVERLK